MEVRTPETMFRDCDKSTQAISVRQLLYASSLPLQSLRRGYSRLAAMIDGRQQDRWWLVAIVVVVGALFARAVGFDFVSWDDPLYVTQNPLIHAPGSVPWSDHWLTPELGYPVPLTVLSYRAEVAVAGGDSAWLVHLSNVALHVLACALVFLVGRRLGLSGLAAAVAALLFGAHPAVAEPVCWATGRKDLLAAVFCLAATWAALGQAGSRRRDIVVWILMLLALSSKPTAVFAGLVLPLWMRSRGDSRRDIVWRFGVVWVVIAVLLPLAYMGHDQISGQQGVGVSRPRAVWYALGHHLRLLFVAHENSVKYVPRPWPPGFAPAVDLVPVAVAAFGLALYRWVDPERRALLRWAGLWIAFAYGPTSSVLPLTRFLADTYVYVPLIGVAWIAGGIVEQIRHRSSHRLAGPMIAVAIISLLVFLQLPSQARWRNSVVLWGSAYDVYPDEPRLCRNVGNALFAQNELDGARIAFEACAARFGGRDFDKNLGITLLKLGRVAEGRAALERAQRHRPKDPVIKRYLEASGRMR